MREIKFRAWAKNAKIMFSDKVTDLVLHFNGEINSINEIGMIEGCFFVKDLELMQYTGLKDKNGVEIYEGDILHHKWDSGNKIMKETISEVKFSNGSFICDDKKREDFDLSIHALSNWAEIEVIGNIYENPELLEEAR